jgi:hypothetical protein
LPGQRQKSDDGRPQLAWNAVRSENCDADARPQRMFLEQARMREFRGRLRLGQRYARPQTADGLHPHDLPIGEHRRRASRRLGTLRERQPKIRRGEIVPDEALPGHGPKPRA